MTIEQVNGLSMPSKGTMIWKTNEEIIVFLFSSLLICFTFDLKSRNLC